MQPIQIQHNTQLKLNEFYHKEELKKDFYEKPAIEIIEMELETSILSSSIPSIPGGDW